MSTVAASALQIEPARASARTSARSRRLAFTLLLAAVTALCPLLRAQLPESGSGQDQPAYAPGASRLVRGTITAVAPDKLTLKTEAGETYTVALTANTQLRHGRDPIKLADVHSGDGAGAMGELDRPNKTVHALFVSVVSAEDIRKAREAMGKTWIAGTITAIDEVKLTVLRADKITQVIQVDEDTSFKRGGRNMQTLMQGSGELGGGYGSGRQNNPAAAPQAESITLADVKIGDSVAGPGTLKSGVFTPTELYVGDPATQRRRRQNPDASGSQPTEPK